MTTVAVEVDASQGLRLLGRLLAAVGNPTQALDAVGFSIAQRVASTFDDQRDPWGMPWEPLAASTIKSRRQEGEGARILRDTGALGNSPTHNVTGDAVEIGSPVEYASFQQFGTRRGIPARAFFPMRSEAAADLPDDWAAEVEGIVDALIQGAGRGA